MHQRPHAAPWLTRAAARARLLRRRLFLFACVYLPPLRRVRVRLPKKAQPAPPAKPEGTRRVAFHDRRDAVEDTLLVTDGLSCREQVKQTIAGARST